VAILWLILGLGCIGAAALIIARLPAAHLGIYSTRLIAVCIGTLAYYSTVSTWGAVHAAHVLRYRSLYYVVPIAAGLAVLYLLWRVAQNWRTEVHNLLHTGLKLLLVAVFAYLARWCLSL
jgi:hypothetical protein